MALVGTTRTLVAWATVMATLALIPARNLSLVPSMETVTGYETTLLEPLVVDGTRAIEATVPVSDAFTAGTVVATFWPTLTEARSDSTTLAVTSYVRELTTIALPDGASRPATMLTVLTTPSIGAVSVAALIWAARSVRDWAACETDRCAL